MLQLAENKYSHALELAFFVPMFGVILLITWRRRWPLKLLLAAIVFGVAVFAAARAARAVLEVVDLGLKEYHAQIERGELPPPSPNEIPPDGVGDRIAMTALAGAAPVAGAMLGAGLGLIIYAVIASRRRPGSAGTHQGGSKGVTTANSQS